MPHADSTNIVYTKTELDIFLKFYEKFSCNISKACRRAKIRGMHGTINRLRQSVPWFDQKMTDIYNAMFDDIEEFGHRKARMKITMAKFMLASSAEGRRRGYGKQHMVGGVDGGPLTMLHLHEATEGVNDEK